MRAPLCAFLRARGVGPEDAEDIAQDCMERLIRYRAHGTEELRLLLYRIFDRHVMAGYWRVLDRLDELLDRAAERGAERVLTHLGLENGHAARDIRELRDLLEAWREARHTAWQTIIKVATTGLLAVILVGAAIKLKLMGGTQ